MYIVPGCYHLIVYQFSHHTSHYLLHALVLYGAELSFIHSRTAVWQPSISKPQTCDTVWLIGWLEFMCFTQMKMFPMISPAWQSCSQSSPCVRNNHPTMHVNVKMCCFVHGVKSMQLILCLMQSLRPCGEELLAIAVR